MKSIYIQSEFYEEVNKEENLSALINSLLKDYYQNKNANDLNLQQLKQRKEDIENEMKRQEINMIKKIKETKEQKLEVIDKMIAEKEQTKEENEKKENEKKAYRIKMFEDHVKSFCDVEEKEIEGIAKMYEEERLNYDTFFDWCKAKKIKFIEN